MNSVDSKKLESKVKVSVILPTYNRGYFLDRCLRSIINQKLVSVELEIILVNDGSSDNTSEVIFEHSMNDSRIVVLQQENSGPAVGRNRGIAASSGQLIAFVDDDCIAAPNWIEELSQQYSDPKVGGVAGQIVYRPPNSSYLNRLAEKSATDAPSFDELSNESFFVTANASVRRVVLDQVGGFDESFPYAAQEDVDLTMRIRKNGWQLKYCSTAIVEHYHCYTFFGELKRWYRQGYSEGYLLTKHGMSSSPVKLLCIELLNVVKIPFAVCRGFLNRRSVVETLVVSTLFRVSRIVLALGQFRFATERKK